MPAPAVNRVLNLVLSLTLAFTAAPALSAQPDTALTPDLIPMGGAARGSLRSVLRPAADIQLSARAAGVIEKFHVAEGARLNRGAPILELNSEQEKAELLQAEAAVRGARAEMERSAAELERIKPLIAENIYSEKQLADARAQVEISRARFEQAQAAAIAAKARLSDRTVVSPIDGIFLKTNKSVGEAVERFETVARIIDVSSLEMVVYCDSQYFSTFQNHDTVRIRVLKTAEQQPLVVGQIVHIDPIIDPASGTFRIKVLVPSSAEGAAPGYTAMLLLPPA